METFPKSFKFIGKTQHHATEYLKNYDITHKRVGDESDDAIIVEQRPQNTIDVWLEKTCVTLGLASSKIIRVQLFHEEAPLSVNHFRKNSNMLYYPIGKLQVLENLKMLMLFLPITGIDSIEAVPRENIQDSASAGLIGVTNALRRLTGTIGIRLIENDIYGPTGETHEGTNIIGQVVSNLDFLKTLDTGDMVWFMEVSNDE